MTARLPPLPVRAVPLGPGVELRVQAFEDRGQGQLTLDVRIYRKSPADLSGAAFCPTATAACMPVHLGGMVADAIRQVAVRAIEQHAIRPPEGARRG